MSEQRFIFRIGPDDVGVRLDVYLADQEDPPISRSQVKRRVDAGEILVNGSVAKAGTWLRDGDEIEWTFAPAPQLSAEPEAIDLDILFEDPHVAIINKPAGMVVHPAIGHPSGTLVNAIMHHFTRLAATDNELRPGIVHRIDKDTSGAIAVTKSSAAHRHLSELFAKHDIDRTYHALVVGGGLPDEGTIDTLHGRHPKDRLRFTGSVHDGRRAVTHFTVLERFEKQAALVECRLETGRTHQIRMHFAERNAPLLADSVYAPKAVAQTKLIKRQALHAVTLGFLQLDGTRVLAEAPYPEDFARALAALRAGRFP